MLSGIKDHGRMNTVLYPVIQKPQAKSYLKYKYLTSFCYGCSFKGCIGQFNTKFSRKKNRFIVVFNIWNGKKNKVQLNNNYPGISLWLHLGKKKTLPTKKKENDKRPLQPLLKENSNKKTS